MSVVDFLWAVPVFGLLIFIHELGHFAVAKWFDIRVDEFALGFGPVVAGFDRGETRYNLRAVPLGGFVRMAGMEDGDNEEPRGFNKKSLLARALVIVAGPVMNFLLAALLYGLFLFFVGVEQMDTAKLGGILQTCQTEVAGQAVSVECPAAKAGLKQGDTVVTIDGKKVATWEEIHTTVSQSGGKPLTFVVQRGVETKEIKVEPLRSGDRWMVGIGLPRLKAPFGTAMVQGAVWTWQVSGLWVSGIVGMVTGAVPAEFSGPVGITRTIAETASAGLDMLVRLAAFLSINLGLFNLLPIPALDGSRLVFIGVEAVRGRKLDPNRENIIHFVGFVLLIGLMLVITFKEVVKLIG